jgi:signal transduction histidine kinase
MLMTRRANEVSSAELAVLKKKNETMEEINQKMQALAHHQRLETIGTMTASIAHDFNNLLTPIMGYSIMTMEMLPADATDLQDNLLEIYDASVKAKDIVNRLAELTKKGKEENYKELDVDEVIQSALKVTLPAKPKEVEVKANFNAEGNMIKADRTQISQLVMNIVLNAYDAMRGDGGTLLVSTRISGEEVVLRFKDSGCGMDTETMSRIFDPFYTTKESGKGTGLGLAIVAQIVETHGGKIYVDSQPGEGTEFRIYIPLAGADQDSLAWGPGGEGKFDTKRYSVNLIRKELARIQAEKEEVERE